MEGLQMRCVARLATGTDLEDVLALYRELRPQDPVLSAEIARSSFEAILQRDDVAIVVLECDGALTATCMLAILPNLASGARPFGVIEHVVTLRAFRRRGYARQVLEHALNLAWSRQCYKVMLLSGAGRTEAHRLYEAVGFNGSVERGFVVKADRGA